MGRRARRPVEWLGRMFGGLPLPASGQNNANTLIDADDSGSLSFSFEHYTQPTIVRIVGNLVFQLNADAAAIDPDKSLEVRYAVGIMCCDEDLPAQNLQAGTAAEMGHPWMWMDVGFLHRPSVGQKVSGAESGSAGVVISADNFTQVYGTPLISHPLDIRAMRKVPRDCELRLVISTHTRSADVSPQVHGFVRCLVKE